MQWVAIALIGAGVGYLGGLFGKGGSAIATPLLAAIGVPPLVAVASPLPATIPGTLVAYNRYRRFGITDGRVVRWSIAFGVPATILGAYLTRYVDGHALIKVTDVLIAGIGAKVLFWPDDGEVVRDDLSHRALRTALVAVAVGLIAGLLANSGGFLLVPLYLAALKLPIKTALSCSLAVAAALAIPGTLVHAALGHIDWTVTLVFGLASVPLSSLGAKTALRMQAVTLERVFGAGLLVLGATLFII